MKKSADIGVLYLHALPLDGCMWAGQMGLWPGRSYAPDLYAFGDEIRAWAARALDLVAERRVLVVGNSVGGSCALEIAQMAPERVAGLVLIGTKARNDLDLAGLDAMGRLVADAGVAAVWARVWAPLLEGTCDPKTKQAARDIALAQASADIINGIRAFYKRPSREDLIAQLNVPICVITGAKDRLPGRRYAERIAATAKRGTCHVIPDCGHYVPMEAPVAFNDLLADFMMSLNACD